MSNLFDPVDAQITKRVLLEILQQTGINATTHSQYYNIITECIQFIDLKTASPAIVKVVDINTQNKLNYDRAMSII